MAWYITSTKKLPFERGSTFKNNQITFYLPYRCPKDAIQGGKICERCTKYKLKKGNTGPGLYWGLITEPIGDITVISNQTNQIAFSPWFFENVKKYGISAENLKKARDAFAVAVIGLNGVPPIPNMVETDPVVKKPRVYKKKVVATPMEPVEPVEPVTVLPIMVEPKVKSSKVKIVKTLPVKKPVAIISEEKPVASEVENIDVLVKELNGTRYYVDTSKSKLYDIKTGEYKGRWDSVTEKIITGIPDSDAE